MIQLSNIEVVMIECGMFSFQEVAQAQVEQDAELAALEDVLAVGGFDYCYEPVEWQDDHLSG